MAFRKLHRGRAMTANGASLLGKSKRKSQRWRGIRWDTIILLGPPLAFLFVLFLVPLALVLWGSFFTPAPSLSAYVRMGSSPVYLRVFWLTLEIAVLTTVLCIVLGYPAALLLARVSPRLRQGLLLCVIVPFFLSILIRNYIWMALLQRSGLFNRILLDWGVITNPLPLMYNEFGVLVTMTNTLLPYTILPILSSLMAIPPELEQASASRGGGALRTFVRVIFPLSLPGVIAGGLLVFIVSLGFFITPALVGGPRQMMVSNLIDFNVREVLNWPFAFALANVLLCGTLLLYFVHVRFSEGQLSAATGLK
jgi:ABC-type spermidine/putrescine transport system permease subunit I